MSDEAEVKPQVISVGEAAYLKHLEQIMGEMKKQTNALERLGDILEGIRLAVTSR